MSGQPPNGVAMQVLGVDELHAEDRVADEVEAALEFLMHGGDAPPSPSVEAVRAMVEYAKAEGHQPDADGFYRLQGVTGHILSFRDYSQREELALQGKIVNKPGVKPKTRRVSSGFRLRMNPLAHAIKTEVVSYMAAIEGETQCVSPS